VRGVQTEVTIAASPLRRFQPFEHNDVVPLLASPDPTRHHDHVKASDIPKGHSPGPSWVLERLASGPRSPK